MRRRDLAVVCGTALATALAALPVLWIGVAVAKEGARPEIQWPVLRANGCQVTLRTDRTSYEAGETPVVELEATNPTGAPVSLEATLQLMVQPQASPMSRRVALPSRRWEHRCVIALASGETRTLSVPTEARLEGNAMVSFRLAVGSAAVVTAPMAIRGTGRPAIATPAAAQPSKQVVQR